MARFNLKTLQRYIGTALGELSLQQGKPLPLWLSKRERLRS